MDYKCVNVLIKFELDQARSQEGLVPLQKNLSRALAAVQIFS